jgi:hypothetical protein
MPWGDVLRNPLLRKALQAGEERLGQVVGKVLANERVAGGVQVLLTGAIQARAPLERGVAQALRAAHVPSRDEVEALRTRIEELEAMLDGLASKAGRGRRGGSGHGG